MPNQIGGLDVGRRWKKFRMRFPIGHILKKALLLSLGNFTLNFKILLRRVDVD